MPGGGVHAVGHLAEHAVAPHAVARHVGAQVGAGRERSAGLPGSVTSSTGHGFGLRWANNSMS